MMKTPAMILIRTLGATLLLLTFGAGCAQEAEAPAALPFAPEQDVAQDIGADTASADSSDSDVEQADDTAVQDTASVDVEQDADASASDAEVDAPTDAGEVEDAGTTGDSTATDATGDSTATDATGDAGPEGPQCLGANDQAQLMSWAQNTIYKWVMVTAQECFALVGGQPGSGVDDEAFHGCVSEAVSGTLELSTGCSLCFGDLAVCSKDNCLASCGAADPDVDENLQGCMDCQVENYCTHSFESCTGLETDA